MLPTGLLTLHSMLRKNKNYTRIHCLENLDILHNLTAVQNSRLSVLLVPYVIQEKKITIKFFFY